MLRWAPVTMVEHPAEQQQRRTELTMVLVGLAIVVVVGGAMLWVLYGRTTALIAVTLVLGGAALLALLWLLLRALERWAHSD